jgi:hypothetical protein
MVYAPAVQYFHPEVTEQRTENINLKAYSEYKISGTSVGIGGCSVIENETSYIINSPEELISKKGYITKQREICKTCPNGKQCLDDGAICSVMSTNSNECGSKICNINLICGSVGTSTMVLCKDGKMNCNNESCLTPSIKKTEEAYSCEWECTPGTIACNGICRAVSSKAEGEEYFCQEECVSQRGNGKVCIWSLEKQKFWENIRNIFFGILILVGLTLVGWFIIYKKVWPLIRDWIKAKEELPNLIIAKENLAEEIKRSNGELIKLKQKEDDLRKEIENEQIKSNEIVKQIRDKENKEIKILQERKRNKKAEAQKIIDEEINRIRKKRQEEINYAKLEEAETLDYLNSQIKTNKALISEEKSKELKLREKIENLKKEIAQIENTSPEREIELLENEYKKEYETGARKIKFDKPKQRFFITSLYGQDEPLSRYVYEKRVLKNKKIGNKKIHHINRNQRIDRPENLIALSEDDHDKILEENIIKDDWESGIKEIKRALNWENSNFPEHIQKEIEKRENQRKAEKYAKRSFRRRK